MDQYEVLGVIGSGSFGRVSRIRRKADGKQLVWKELYYGNMSDKEKQLLVSEVNILRELRHPHIVRYYDRIIDRDRKKIYIVMEYCSGGDLGALIKKARREGTLLDEETVWRIFVQCLCALKECHNRDEGAVLHRDLKPGNIFLDAQSNVKLGDFGLARVLSKSSMFAYTNVGTPFYMSPEQVNEVPYNQKSDIWSLGCLMYELCALAPPFEAQTQVALAMKIREGRFKPIPSSYSRELRDVITNMLQVDQSRRMNVDQLLDFPPISSRLRERKMAMQISAMKKREEELREKEVALDARQRALDERERQLEAREKALEMRAGLAIGGAVAAGPSAAPAPALAPLANPTLTTDGVSERLANLQRRYEEKENIGTEGLLNRIPSAPALMALKTDATAATDFGGPMRNRIESTGDLMARLNAARQMQ